MAGINNDGGNSVMGRILADTAGKGTLCNFYKLFRKDQLTIVLPGQGNRVNIPVIYHKKTIFSR
jgi:hypothetical protein